MGFNPNKKSMPNCQTCSQQFNNVFCMMEKTMLDKIDAERIHTNYKKGETIFKEGTRPFGVFCLQKGKVKLVKNGEDGRDHILRLHRAGDLLGYRSLFSNAGYNASAIALEDCDVCFVSREVFLESLKRNSELSFEMLQLLAEDLRRADIHLTNLAQKPVRERAAEALLFIQETYGFAADGKTLNASFSREEIANIVGTATESIIRVLSEFNKEGIVVLKGKKISIPDVKSLSKVASL